MYLRGSSWKLVPKMCRGIITHRHYGSGMGEQFRERHNKVAWRKNIIRMRRETERNCEKLIDPICGSRGHSGKMGVDTSDSLLPQPHTNIDRLIKPKKIRLPSPFF